MGDAHVSRCQSVGKSAGPSPAFAIDMRRVLEIDCGELVPAIFQSPDATGPFPAALILHGFSSDKERMADSIGRALLARGVASLASVTGVSMS